MSMNARPTGLRISSRTEMSLDTETQISQSKLSARMESLDKGVPGQTAKGFITGEENSMMAKEGSFEGPGFGSKQPDLNSDSKKGMEHRNASSSATASSAELGEVLLSDAEVYYESLLGQLDFLNFWCQNPYPFTN